jgi:hypothetical protein
MSLDLTVAVANLGVAKLGRYVPLTGAPLFFFYAGCCLVAAVALALIARRYRMLVTGSLRPAAELFVANGMNAAPEVGSGGWSARRGGCLDAGDHVSLRAVHRSSASFRSLP